MSFDVKSKCACRSEALLGPRIWFVGIYEIWMVVLIKSTIVMLSSEYKQIFSVVSCIVGDPIIPGYILCWAFVHGRYGLLGATCYRSHWLRLLSCHVNCCLAPYHSCI